MAGYMMIQFLDRWFGIRTRGSSLRLEILGGATTFATMAYIIVVNPAILANNRFKIAGGKPGGKVSWQVTGVRHDAYANAHRIPVEEDKGNKRGTYLHPELFQQQQQQQEEPVVAAVSR